jgi:hypothetical protein
MSLRSNSKALNAKYGITKTISFEVPDEWYDVVDAAFEALSKLPEWDPDKVAQVKEKFGTLRIYLNGDLDMSPDAQEIISQAEKAVSAYKIY